MLIATYLSFGPTYGAFMT